jgi:hypothetical protein
VLEGDKLLSDLADLMLMVGIVTVVFALFNVLGYLIHGKWWLMEFFFLLFGSNEPNQSFCEGELDMMKAETVEQFYVLKWLEVNFETSLLEIKLADRYTVKIRDREGKIARVTYAGKDDIQLTDDTTF